MGVDEMQCHHFQRGECLSCGWLDRTYPNQLAAKDEFLHALLDPYQPQDWRPPVSSPPAGFRNKAKMAVLGSTAAPILGIVNHRGEEIGLCDCPLYPGEMQDILQRLRAWIQQAGLPPYKVDQRQGELKFVLLTRSQFNGEYMLRFVLRSEQVVPRIRQFLPMLLADAANIRVVSVNIQPVHMAIIEGDKEIFLTPDTRLSETLNDVPLFIRPKSFFQTNPVVAAALYATARRWVAQIRPASLWDLYCGVGGFGLHCATPDMRVTGIEIEHEAIACAQQSALAMGLNQMTFAALDLTDFAIKKAESPDLVIVNPPRRGIGQVLCAQLVQVAPQYILYSSCRADTLAQDLVRLRGYRLARVQLFDMFPHTPHYEVLSLLVRENRQHALAAGEWPPSTCG